jgi:hypothetical protein
MATGPEGVIYLEVDEDITSAIDKLTKSTSKSIQMVTAKRSTLFQSVINLKLLQKAAKEEGKQLVLVTGDRVATNLAGRLGVLVATQVGEAAKVPTVGAAVVAAEDEIDGGTIGEDTPEANPAAAPTPLSTEPDPAPVAPPPSPKTGPKKPRVPSVKAMQKRVLLGVAAVLVIILLFVLNHFLTSAAVTLYAKANQNNATLTFTADPTANQSDTANSVLTAQQLTTTKSLTTLAQATGTQDDGSKASGTMTVNNCYDVNPHTLVAGTRFVAPDGNVFVSTGDVTVPGGKQSGIFGGPVTPGTATVGVQSSANGGQYNEAPATYTIPGLPSSEQATSCSASGGGIYGTGNQMQGGVTKVDKVVSQSDVNQAVAAALAADKSSSATAVSAKASSDQVVLTASLTQTAGSITPNPAVGAVANNSNVTIQVTYTELAVAKADLSSLAKSQESQQLGGQNQIYDDGTGSLQLTAVGNPTSSGAQRFKAAATIYDGPKIDTTALATQLKGQKYGDATQTASQVNGVDRATIKLTPGWGTSLPGITSHIHIQIKVDNSSG